MLWDATEDTIDSSDPACSLKLCWCQCCMLWLAKRWSPFLILLMETLVMALICNASGEHAEFQGPYRYPRSFWGKHSGLALIIRLLCEIVAVMGNSGDVSWCMHTAPYIWKKSVLWCQWHYMKIEALLMWELHDMNGKWWGLLFLLLVEILFMAVFCVATWESGEFDSP